MSLFGTRMGGERCAQVILLREPGPAGRRAPGIVTMAYRVVWEWIWCCVELSLRFGNWKTMCDPGKEGCQETQPARPSNTQFLLSWELELSCNQAMI